MTNRQLMALVRKGGKFEMPVLTGDGVEHIIVVKTDLLRVLALGPADGPACWDSYGMNGDVHRLDIARG